MKLTVSKDLFMEAPDGDAIYFCSPTYTSAAGKTLIAKMRHESLCFQPDGSTHWYEKHIYEARSEDNGKSWQFGEDEFATKADDIGGEQWYPARTILDEKNDVLIRLSCSYDVNPDEPCMGIGNTAGRTRRMFYEISSDAGETWTGIRQVIDSRSGHDEVDWAPGIKYGHTGGIASGQHVFLPDGTLVLGFVASHPDIPEGNPTPRVREHYATTLYAQATLAADKQSLCWSFGDMIEVEFPKSSDGCCEPALALIPGDRLFNTMRCQGDEGAGIYSTRYTTVSDDGGLTWSEPTPLVYDDGETVWTPASVHRFFVSSKTGKTYLLANILPGPVHGQMPRYPLTIAEFDTERACVLKNTISVIQDLPEDAPEQRRYTNWGMYEERGVCDLIMIMPEQPKSVNFTDMTKPEDYTSDCVKFRIKM